MNYEQLIKVLEQRKFNGYRNKDSVNSSGGSGWGAGALSIIGDLILMSSFTTNDGESQIMESLEKKLSNLILREREVADYRGNLVSVNEWREDQGNGLMIEISKGFLFPSRKSNIYSRGFGHPKIYQLKDGERLLDIYKESNKLKIRAAISLLTMPVAIPLYYLVNPAVGYGFIGLVLAYSFYNATKEYRLKRPEPIIPEEGSIKKLCKLYA